MKRVVLFVTMCALAAIALPFGAQSAGAQAPPPPWQTGSWSGVGTTAVTTTLTGPDTLHVTDYQCVGDRFIVLIDGASVGSTSNTPPPGDECGAASPDEACADGRFSSGAFPIPAGDHAVEIRHLSGFGGGSVGYRTGTVGCVNVVTSGAFIRGLQAQCIESDYIQTNAQGSRVGSVIHGGPDDVLIATGPPTCQFNCTDGFDINCDGKIGDFCPVELDRHLVDNVKPCLDAGNPSVPAAASAAAPAAIAVGESTLAQPGLEDELAIAGAALLTYGAVALGVARHVRRRKVDGF